MGKRRSRRSNGTKSIVCSVGNMTYKIARLDDGLRCPCGKKPLCQHIEKVVSDKLTVTVCDNESESDTFRSLTFNDYIRVYEKIQDHISQIWTSIDLSETTYNKVRDIYYNDCGFCCYELAKDPKREGWVKCDKCGNLAHAKCYYKWEGKKKGCMYCRQ